MGGNAIFAIDGVQGIRVDRKQYDLVASSVSAFLKSSGYIAQFAPFSFFEEKVDFGDMDVLVSLNSTSDRYAFEEAFNAFANNNAVKWIKNGNVSSFAYQLSSAYSFQIDFIFCDQSLFEMTYAYHGNGDLGNLIGRIAHNMGIKYGHDGLWYKHLSDTYAVGDILLSKKPDDILSFLGYSTPVPAFKTNEDVYRYVISSPYFHPSFFHLENRNHASKVRDRKRPSHMRFLQFIETIDFDEKPLIDKRFAMVAIMHFGKMDEYMVLVQQEAMRIHAKSILHPAWVSAQTGLTKESLGALMQSLKQEYHPSDLIGKNILEARSIIQRIGNFRKD